MTAKRKSLRNESEKVKNSKELTPEALESLVCGEFCKGRSVEEIVDALRDRVELSRERPYAIVRRAARLGRILYVPPLANDLMVRILEDHRLEKVRIVDTVNAEDVALLAADMVLDLIRGWAEPDLHLGFAGGGLAQNVASALARKLQRPGKTPKRIFFHALVAAAWDPLRSPNAFLYAFREQTFSFETHFVPLPAPGLVSQENLDKLRTIDGIKDAFDRKGEIDCVVTSAGAHWGKGCSVFHAAYEDYAKKKKQTRVSKQLDIVGDVLWHPISSRGLPVKLDAIAVTLLNTHDLAEMVRNGKQVILAVAPCGTCHEHKGEVLRAIFNGSGEPIATRLVADVRSAAAWQSLNDQTTRGGR